MAIVLITGISGQDGSYLTDLLIPNHQIVGLIRRHSNVESQTTNIEQHRDNPNLTLEYADVTDAGNISVLVNKYQPDYLIHFAAQSHVQISSASPAYTAQVNALGTLNILEAVKNHSPHTRVYHACTSEVFGNQIDADGFQRLTTPMVPVSPYGAAKLFAHNLCHHYRNAYDLNIVSGIAFNHTSPRRSSNFVEMKIVRGVKDILLGKADKLVLGNLDVQRDISDARDIVQGIWKCLQVPPQDWIFASGHTVSVAYLCNLCFSQAGLNWEDYVITSDKYKRAEELKYLKGDAQDTITKLDWHPRPLLETLSDLWKK